MTPTAQEQKKDPLWEKRFDKKLKKHKEKLEECESTKQIAFVKLLGQCSPAVRNQLEASKNHATIEQSADVPQLPQLIESIVHSNEGVQCDCWALSFAVRKLTTMKQGKGESLISHCHQFNNAVQAVKSQWGLPLPTQQIATVDDEGNAAASTLDADKQAARNRHLACVFIAGAHHNKCGACIAELDNSHIAGNSKCPTTVSAALHHLNNCSTGEKSHRPNHEEKNNDQEPELQVPGSNCTQVGLHAPTELNNHQKEKITCKT